MSITETAPQAQGKIVAIQTILASAANWRQAMAKKYATDVRNSHAAKLLHALANEMVVLPDHLITELDACHGTGAAAKDTARRVGFSLFPASLLEFVYSVLLHVAEQRADIDAVFPAGERSQ
jgi:hypothetical protein